MENPPPDLRPGVGPAYHQEHRPGLSRGPSSRRNMSGGSSSDPPAREAIPALEPGEIRGVGACPGPRVPPCLS